MTPHQADECCIEDLELWAKVSEQKRTAGLLEYLRITYVAFSAGQGSNRAWQQLKAAEAALKKAIDSHGQPD